MAVTATGVSTRLIKAGLGVSDPELKSLLKDAVDLIRQLEKDGAEALQSFYEVADVIDWGQ